MNQGISLFEIRSATGFSLVAFSILLLVIFVVAFRSRSVVFCQYLKAMTGIQLKPAEVRRAFAGKGQAGVRHLFLELIIREDLEEGPLKIPESAAKDPGANLPQNPVGEDPTEKTAEEA